MLFDGKIFVLRKVFHMISHYLGRNGMLQSYFFQRESVNEVLVEQEKSLHASSKSKLFFFFLGGGGGNQQQQQQQTTKHAHEKPNHKPPFPRGKKREETRFTCCNKDNGLDLSASIISEKVVS